MEKLFKQSLSLLAGFMCNCVLPVTLNSTKVRHHRIDDKPCESEKKKLTSEQNGVTSSNSSSSSSSSPSGATLRRGRSRTRRALPPSSPLILDSSTTSWRDGWNLKQSFSPIFLRNALKRKKAKSQFLNLYNFYFIFFSFVYLGLKMPSSSRESMHAAHVCTCFYFFGGGNGTSLQKYPSWPRLFGFLVSERWKKKRKKVAMRTCISWIHLNLVLIKPRI